MILKPWFCETQQVRDWSGLTAGRPIQFWEGSSAAAAFSERKVRSTNSKHKLEVLRAVNEDPRNTVLSSRFAELWFNSDQKGLENLTRLVPSVGMIRRFAADM